MSASPDATQRLIELERILSRASSPAARDDDADPAALHLAGVPTERIRRLTAELRARPEGERDEIGAIAVRLLLNDYTTAVGHLRAVARLAVSRIDQSAVTIKECQKAIRREQKLDVKRSGTAAE